MQGFGRRQVGHRFAEQDAAEDFVFGQRWHRAEGDLRPAGGAGDIELRGQAIGGGGRGDVDRRIGRRGTLETQIAAGEGEAFAGEIIIAAHQFDAPDDFRGGDRAANLQIGAPFGFKAHARDEQPPVGVDCEVEQPAGRRRINVDAATKDMGVDLGHRQYRHVCGGGAAEAIAQIVDMQLARDDAAIFIGGDPHIAGGGGVDFVTFDQRGVFHRQADIHRETAFGGQIDAARRRNAAIAADAATKAQQFKAGLGEARLQRRLVDDGAKRGAFDAGAFAARRADKLRVAEHAADIRRNRDGAAHIDARHPGEAPYRFGGALVTQLAEHRAGEQPILQRCVARGNRADTHLRPAFDLAGAHDHGARRGGIGGERRVDADIDRHRCRGNAGA